MKSTVKFFLVVILFTTTVFAEGDLGNGSKNCPQGTTCLVETQPTEPEVKATDSEDSILAVVREYLGSVLEYFEN